MENEKNKLSFKICLNGKCYAVLDINYDIEKLVSLCSDVVKGGGPKEEVEPDISYDDYLKIKDKKLSLDDIKSLFESLSGGGTNDDESISMDRFLASLNKNILSKCIKPINTNIPESGGKKKKKKRKVYGNDVTSDEEVDYNYTESKLLELADDD